MTALRLIDNESYVLWWRDEKNNKFYPAGVAFYEPNYGEYRLKIDLMPETHLFLRPIGSQDDVILYRLEIVIKKNNKFMRRVSVGEGQSDPKQNRDVLINLYAYSRELILVRRKNE